MKNFVAEVPQDAESVESKASDLRTKINECSGPITDGSDKKRITTPEMMACKQIGNIEKTVKEKTDVEWKITNILSASSYESPHFVVENASWFFKLCPKWSRESDFMRLYLMTKEQRDYTVEYKLCSKLANDSVEVLARGFLREKHMCSDPVFIRPSSTTIICSTLKREITPPIQLTKSEKELVTTTGEISEKGIYKHEVVECKELEDINPIPIAADEINDSDFLFETDIKWLLEKRKNIDVTFQFESSDCEKEIFAHQLILAMWSSYFAEKFYEKEKKKKQQFISLTGVDSQIFEKMIRYCYGYDPGLQKMEEAYSLFKVASEFKVISLVNLCSTFLRHTKIYPENVFMVLEISEKIDDKSLRENCKKVLEEKTKEVVASYKLCDITLDMMHNILDLSKLALNCEYDLINWIVKWAKVKSKDKDSIYKNARECSEKLFRGMNFLSLTIKEFAMLCMHNPNLFMDDEIASISLNIALPGARKMPDWYDKDLKVRVYTGSKT